MDISLLAEEVASEGIQPEGELFGFRSALEVFLKYLYGTVLGNGHRNYVNIRIP